MFEIFKNKTIHAYFDLLSSTKASKTDGVLERIGRELDKGLDPNVRNNDGLTALSRLIDGGTDMAPGVDLEFLTLLMEAGADPLLPHKAGEIDTIWDGMLDSAARNAKHHIKIHLILEGAVKHLQKPGVVMEQHKSNLLHAVCGGFNGRWSHLPYMLLHAAEDCPALTRDLCLGRDEKGNTALQKLWQWASAQGGTQSDQPVGDIMHFWSVHKNILNHWVGAEGEREHYDSVLVMAKKARDGGFPFLWDTGETVLADIQARDIAMSTPDPASKLSKRRF